MDTAKLRAALVRGRSAADWVASIAKYFADADLSYGHGADNPGDEAYWLVRAQQGWSEQGWSVGDRTGKEWPDPYRAEPDRTEPGQPGQNSSEPSRSEQNGSEPDRAEPSLAEHRQSGRDRSGQNCAGPDGTGQKPYGLGDDRSGGGQSCAQPGRTGQDRSARGHAAPADGDRIDALVDLAERRVAERKPLAYLLGEAWFAGLRFSIDERVAVPRSPLAELIERRFEPWLRLRPGDRVLDVGTGSGCLAIATARHCAGVTVDATDISPDALAVAARNVREHGLEERVRLIRADLYGDSSVPTGPDRPVGPSGPSGPGGATRRGGATVSTGSPDPNGPRGPSGPGKPGGSADATEPTEPGQPARRGGATDSTGSPDSNGPRGPSWPCKPGGSADATEPTEPGQPARRGGATVSSGSPDPNGPRGPSGPGKPGGSADATEPTEPGQPARRGGATVSSGPGGSTGPDGSSASSATAGPYRIIVSNPPYVPSRRLAELPAEYGHEPGAALDGGEHGLDLVDRLLAGAAERLTDDGVLIVEVGEIQAAFQSAYPHLPATWIEFRRGGEGVFLLTHDELGGYLRNQDP